MEGELLGLSGLIEGLGDAEIDEEGLILAEGVGLTLALLLGDIEAESEAEGEILGDMLGLFEGDIDGL